MVDYQALQPEQRALGALLLTERPLALIAEHGVKAADFAEHGHADIFMAIERAGGVNGRGRADIDMVFDELLKVGRAEACGGLEYVHQLMVGVATDRNFGTDIKRMREASLKAMTVASLRLAALRVDGAADLVGALQDARRIVEDAVEATCSAQPVRPRTLDLRALVGRRAPPRHWFLPQWLGDGPTLLASKGGVGKTLLIQQAATAGAIGGACITPASEPFRSLLWCCEDDADELWRRQECISSHLGIAIDAPADRLVIQSRRGVDNVLMAEDRGALARTRVFDDLRQQVNDLRIDVLWLDNVAHLFAGDENSRGPVTSFINAMSGLVTGRNFAVVLVAHTARALGSEYAGSAAWENACRMRWLLGAKLPDHKDDVDDFDSQVRYLAKRKANYTASDYVRFTLTDGVLVPDAQTGGVAQSSRLDEMRAEQLVVAGFRSLQSMGIAPTDGKNSPDYLPRQLAEKGLCVGYNKSEMERAMNRLMARGTFTRGVIGAYSNRTPKMGLLLHVEGVA